jgi:hypothetical protein
MVIRDEGFGIGGLMDESVRGRRRRPSQTREEEVI